VLCREGKTETSQPKGPTQRAIALIQSDVGSTACKLDSGRFYTSTAETFKLLHRPLGVGRSLAARIALKACIIRHGSLCRASDARSDSIPEAVPGSGLLDV
jgi:hypothetical protein